MKLLISIGFLSHLTLQASAQSLQQALQDNGLTDFAQSLQDTGVDILTDKNFIVYAPSNEAVQDRLNDTAAVRRRDDKDDESEEDEKKKRISEDQYQCTTDIIPVLRRRQGGGATSGQGAVFQSWLSDPEYANLGAGNNQSVVQKGSVVRSGLGIETNVVAADIPFDGGVIRPVDQYFTLPKDLSTTLPSVSLGVFKSALERTGLLDTFNNTPGLTVLAPQNSALENTSCWWSDTKLTAALKQQALIDFPGYTPLLKNNTSFDTLAGTSVTVVIHDDGRIVIGGAEILAADIIVKNGVLHGVNGWTSASASNPPPPVMEAGAIGANTPSVYRLAFTLAGCLVAGAFLGF